MTQFQEEQVRTFVEHMVLIDPPPAALGPKMRYQRHLLAEITMYWPDVDQVRAVERIISPTVRQALSA